jgi:hypothetical protein
MTQADAPSSVPSSLRSNTRRIRLGVRRFGIPPNVGPPKAVRERGNVTVRPEPER